MTVAGWGLILAFVGLLGLHRIYTADSPGRVERGLYSIAGVDPARDQGWLAYAASVMAFNLGSIVLLFAILKPQAVLPLNPNTVHLIILMVLEMSIGL